MLTMAVDYVNEIQLINSEPQLKKTVIRIV